MQMSLFENNVEKLQLYKAVDDIKDRFGSKLVNKAVTLNKKENQPPQKTKGSDKT
jgi:DNA polymerase-4